MGEKYLEQKSTPATEKQRTKVTTSSRQHLEDFDERVKTIRKYIRKLCV